MRALCLSVYLKQYLKTAIAHSKSHGIHVNMIRLRSLGCLLILRKCFYKRRRCILVLKYCRIKLNKWNTGQGWDWRIKQQFPSCPSHPTTPLWTYLVRWWQPFLLFCVGYFLLGYWNRQPNIINQPPKNQQVKEFTHMQVNKKKSSFKRVSEAILQDIPVNQAILREFSVRRLCINTTSSASWSGMLFSSLFHPGHPSPVTSQIKFKCPGSASGLGSPCTSNPPRVHS